MTRADAADAEWDEAAEAIGAADIGDQLGGRPCRVQGRIRAVSALQHDDTSRPRPGIGSWRSVVTRPSADVRRLPLP